MIDVLIVGGGVSGLTSYRRIKKADKNLNVKILEAKGEVIYFQDERLVHLKWLAQKTQTTYDAVVVSTGGH